LLLFLGVVQCLSSQEISKFEDEIWSILESEFGSNIRGQNPNHQKSRLVVELPYKTDVYLIHQK